jgi:hypothetical protein
MSTVEAQRLLRKLVTLLILILCLSFLATTNSVKASRQICCSLCNGEPTDPGACHYGCRPSC